ncbi:hypothetical protein [Helicobacter sp. MIT 05-5294]|uniref:hypothetical protein n=1 Tax=Helicobacter sp. MIT 05-5294 TaxID=1548150 RepID=UPI0010FE191B|nr:hypothetical protein [Helicobacter sp. MIT 05-5294]TLD85414.1 hypothetical protein LS69_009695 [Helicobacter sp. MIT 05-5294]
MKYLKQYDRGFVVEPTKKDFIKYDKNRLKLIYWRGGGLFVEITKSGEYIKRIPEMEILDWFLKIYSQARKTDILELLEYNLLGWITGLTEFQEFDQVLRLPFSKYSQGYDYQTHKYLFNEPIPSFEANYFSIFGELFLCGYVDFLAEEPKDVYLSDYKENIYESWKYFRDNFLYAGAFDRNVEDGNLTIGSTSWDTPQYWSQYNILVVRTEKGDKYFNEILAPRFYNKYKDLEVEIDNKGNIIRWIGEINR